MRFGAIMECAGVRSLVIAVATGAIALGGSGCANQGPSGNSGGRIDPYRSKGRITSDRAASTPEMLEACDKTAAAVASRIGDVVRRDHPQSKVVIELGLIENQTHGTMSNDFDLIRRRLTDRLVNSDVVRQVARINEAPESMDAQSRRFEQTQPVDRMDENLSAAAPSTARYAGGDTYLLNGYFGEQSRSGAAYSFYFFQMKLVNLQTREVLFSEPFEFAQTR